MATKKMVYEPATPRVTRCCRIGGNDWLFQDIEFRDRPDSHWLSFLDSRGIDTEVALDYCGQIGYLCHQRHHTALTFGNRSGGFAVRGQYHAGLLEPHDISVVSQGGAAGDAVVFADFMDFLSFKTLVLAGRLREPRSADCVVLHSEEYLPLALDFLKNRDRLYCCFANNADGQALLSRFCEAFPGKVTDLSPEYSGYKNLQALLRGRGMF